MKRILIALVLLLTLTAVPVSAQTYLTNTTLTTAIDATATNVTLGATTSVEVGGALYIDHELMTVLAVNTTTKVARVSRLQRPISHAAAAVVYIATKAQKPIAMLPHDAAVRAGSCTLSSSPYFPIFDTDTGDYYFCEFAASGSATRTWKVNNVLGLNGAGSLRTAWP